MHVHWSARLVCVLTLLATPAAGQSATEEGIRAVLRADYQAAVRILRPLADDAARPDPVAQFFLALLYEAGQGPRGSQARACGLFLRAAGQAHPFAEQSAAIATFMQGQLGGAASLLCIANESWQGGPPQTFLLGPSHQIVFADTSVTVTYGEQEQRTMMVMSPEVAVLPIQYTPLAVTRPIATRRHFFQWFQWMPDRAANPSSWKLVWALSEVVGDQWITITSEQNLAVANGPIRPASRDVTDLVRLRANASGEAEVTILGGTSPRTEVIPPQGNR